MNGFVLAFCAPRHQLLLVWTAPSLCRESAETIVLLEAILDGLGHERSGARRELCANAAREFLVWSAKHIPMVKGKEGSTAQKGSHASSNLNAASLLRRLFERLVNPQTYLRSALVKTACMHDRLLVMPQIVASNSATPWHMVAVLVIDLCPPQEV